MIFIQSCQRKSDFKNILWGDVTVKVAILNNLPKRKSAEA